MTRHDVNGAKGPAAADATVEQLRHEIDRGRTGDKVDFPDSAAAPLGTDDEAAGTPADGARAQLALATEAAKRPDEGRTVRGAFWVLAAVAAVSGIAVIGWMLFLETGSRGFPAS